MESRGERIKKLTDQQALSVLDSLVAEFSNDETPDGREGQVEALQELMIVEGHEVNVSNAVTADAETAAKAARKLLLTMSEVPEIQPSLDEWLDNPPVQEAAAIPLILAAPVVLTGCIVVLQLVGHASIRRNTNGKWSWGYDSAKKTPLDNTMKDMVGAMSGLMRSLLPIE